MKTFIDKNDLLFKNRYRWNKDKAEPILLSFSIFDRHVGNDVLGLIKQLMIESKLTDLKSAQKIETMLISLPNEDQTVSQVSRWVINNWNIKLQLPKNTARYTSTRHQPLMEAGY